MSLSQYGLNSQVAERLVVGGTSVLPVLIHTEFRFQNEELQGAG